MKTKKENPGLNEKLCIMNSWNSIQLEGSCYQQDVTEAACILTGWTIFPMAEYGEGTQNKVKS